ncbi:MAG: DUF2760 domain-containing protein [Alphaproteobacteria bacterium]
MSDQTARRGSGAALSSLLLLLLAAANAWSVWQLGSGAVDPAAPEALDLLRTGEVAAAFRRAAEGGALPWLLVPTLGTLLAALVLGLAARRRAAAWLADAGATGAKVATGADGEDEDERVAAEAATAAREREASAKKRKPVVAPPPPPSPEIALRLLAALQEEARLLDFVQEDLSGASDADIGGAVRGIQAALRKSIAERIDLEPILPGEDGDAVEVPQGFDPARIRVTGRPSGEPPFRGVLRHGGWRAKEARLPQPSSGSDPAILMPAEVEVG